MLYGTSLLAGVLGAAHIPTMAQRLIELNLPGRLEAGDLSVLVLALGGLMLGVVLAFKLSAVPFHFWCPDVFEGALTFDMLCGLFEDQLVAGFGQGGDGCGRDHELLSAPHLDDFKSG